MAEESMPFEELRARYKESQKQLASFEKELEELRTFRQSETFRRAGFDPDSKQGRALMKLHDGEITVEAIRETAESFGLTVAADEAPQEQLPPATQARMQQQTVMNEVTSTARGGGAVDRMSHEDFRKLIQTNPREAAARQQRGEVDMDPQIAAALENNRNFNPIGR